MVDLKYPAVQALIEPQLRRHPTESRAFLAWALENIYRLSDSDADDAVCDGSDDQGIDGLYRDDNRREIHVFQSKIFQNARRTIGDASLREFEGALSQFETADAAAKLAEATKNAELSGRIHELEVVACIKNGFTIVGLFFTNADLDENGRRYLGRNERIRAFDNVEINKLYISPDRANEPTARFSIDISTHGFLETTAGGKIRAFFAPVAATELVQMPGIESGTLFEPNLRQSLGNTQVNREISKTIKQAEEHQQFLLYHNGITIVAEAVESNDKKEQLELRNFYVVNGCQSLTSWYENRKSVTKDIRLLVRIIEVGANSDLVGKITHRSNNQNSIKARDFKSNDAIQVRLQNEFNALFKGHVFYRIKRGEDGPAGAELIDNELAAALLLSFDLKEPWSSHQRYKFFDDLYVALFGRPEVTALRIYTIWRLFRVVEDNLKAIADKRFGAYRLTAFFVLYLLSEALATTDSGKSFCQDPANLIKDPADLDVLLPLAANIVRDLIVDVNHEVEDQKKSSGEFDFKRDMKSAKAIRALSSAVTSGYEKQVQRGRIPSFDTEWYRAKTAVKS